MNAVLNKDVQQKKVLLKADGHRSISGQRTSVVNHKVILYLEQSNW